VNIIQVKNFERFQHYKDRSPPWIKLYNDLLDDYEFAGLPDASKAHLLAIWLLASRYNNEIPADAVWIARRINATDPINLDLLKAAGFLLEVQVRSKALARRKQSACLETEGETEKEREKEEERKAEVRASAPAGKVNGGGSHERTKGSRLPATWQPDDEARRYAEGLGLDAGAIAEQFRDFWHAKPGAGAVKLDWSATWRTWCRKEAERRANGTGGGRPRAGGYGEAAAWLISRMQGEEPT
jgi:hypothetical protein